MFFFGVFFIIPLNNADGLLNFNLIQFSFVFNSQSTINILQLPHDSTYAACILGMADILIMHLVWEAH